MAYNWGSGLGGMFSGAATGAAAGSFLPGPGNLIGAVGGGLLGLGSGFETEGQTDQLNPYTQRYWDLASQNLTNYQRQMESALGQQDSVLGQVEGLGQRMADFSPEYTFDPAASLRMTHAQLPQLQQLAEASMGEYGMSPEAMQRRMTSAAQRTAGQFNELGGLGSGAAAGAIGEAGARVADEANQRQSQLYQQSLMDLLGRQQQMNLQGLQQRLQAQQQGDQMRMQSMQAGAGALSDIAGQYGQQANIFGNIAGQALSGMGAMSGPEFLYEPGQQPGQDLLSGLTTAAGIGLQAKEAGLFDDASGFDFSSLFGDGNDAYGQSYNYPYRSNFQGSYNPFNPTQLNFGY